MKIEFDNYAAGDGIIVIYSETPQDRKALRVLSNKLHKGGIRHGSLSVMNRMSKVTLPIYSVRKTIS